MYAMYQINIAYCDETKEIANNSQTVRAKEIENTS